MAGYTPVFDSIVRGTLCGKWPDIGLWGVLLAMTDFRGEIDATPQYIATVTGLPVTEVASCIKRFCEPDPGSRSQAERGARLVLIDPKRDWGWRVVNIQFYRDKASNMNQIVDGRNAEKVRRYKEKHRRTPPDTGGHRETPPNTDSYSDTNTDSNKEKNKTVAVAPIPGLDSESWTRWLTYRSESGKPLKPASIPAAQRKLASFGTQQSAVVEESIANGYQGLFAPKNNRSGAKVSEWE